MTQIWNAWIHKNMQFFSPKSILPYYSICIWNGGCRRLTIKLYKDTGEPKANALWQCRGAGWGGRWGRRKGHMYTDGWFMLMYMKSTVLYSNYHSIKNKIKFKKIKLYEDFPTHEEVGTPTTPPHHLRVNYSIKNKITKAHLKSRIKKHRRYVLHIFIDLKKVLHGDMEGSFFFFFFCFVNAGFWKLVFIGI